MREAVLEVLARHDVPGSIARRAEHEAELVAIEAELAQIEPSIPWWERVAFFRDTADELRVASLTDRRDVVRAALAEATRASESAIAAASAELPVVGVATRVEGVIARALADGNVGLGGTDDGVVATELEALADHIALTWVPGLDAAAVLASLGDDAQRASAAARCPATAPAEDLRLGWAPITSDELVARAAASLRTATFTALRAQLHREASEHAALAAHLRELRKASTTLDVMMGRNLEAHHAAIAVERRLPREHAELVSAFESFDHALLAALGAFPPMRLALAAQRAAGVLRARLHAAEPTLDAQGALVLALSPRFRALFLAALVDLRAALDDVLPGLGPLLGGRGSARDAADLAQASAARRPGGDPGPYRRRAPVADEPPAPPHPRDLEAHLAATLGAMGLGQRRDRALAHAAMIASIARWKHLAGERIGVVDRLAFWSESAAEEAAAGLEARERWHRGLAHALIDDAIGVVRAGGQGVFVLALRDALLATHAAAERLGTRRGSSSVSMACPVFHHGEALAAVDALSRVVGSSWGLAGTRAHLAAAVTEHLRRAPPSPSPAASLRGPRALVWNEVVVSIAEALRGGPWLAIHDQHAAAAAAHHQATAAARAADAQVTTWARVNVFTDSPAEAERDQRTTHADQAAIAGRAAGAHLDAMLDAALGVYPPAAVYFGLEAVGARIAAVRAVLRRRTTTTRVGKTSTTTTHYSCELLGKADALHALRRWTVAATAVFGHLPSDGAILAGAWSRPLRGVAAPAIPIAAPAIA